MQGSPKVGLGVMRVLRMLQAHAQFNTVLPQRQCSSEEDKLLRHLAGGFSNLQSMSEIKGIPAGKKH